MYRLNSKLIQLESSTILTGQLFSTFTVLCVSDGHAGMKLKQQLRISYFFLSSLLIIPNNKSLIWFVFARNEPREMSSISPAEQAYIDSDLGGTEVGYVNKLTISDIPVRAILTNPCFWGLITSGFCASIFDFVAFNMLTKYLKYVHNFSLEKMVFRG